MHFLHPPKKVYWKKGRIPLIIGIVSISVTLWPMKLDPISDPLNYKFLIKSLGTIIFFLSALWFMISTKRIKL